MPIVRRSMAMCAAVIAMVVVDLRADESPCQVHVILFVTAGVEAPKDYQSRVDEMVGYAEAFFRREMKRWGHKDVVMPFRRTQRGRAEVTLIQGSLKADEYKPVALRAEVMTALRKQNKIDEKRQVWWILVYTGDPPARFSEFLGGFGEQIGGWAVCNFDTSRGRIDPDDPLGCDFLEKIQLKGMIHELGHGFRLPHIGPLERDKAGNTLMGPTHFNYQRVKPGGEERVYLSEAEAALLSTHPAFRGKADARGRLPKVQTQDMTYAASRDAIVVTGRITSSPRPLYALVADESGDRPGEYWTKTYVGKVAADGTFKVVITEPARADGTLKTWFAFNTGDHTGDGLRRSRESGIAKEYTFGRNQWTFK